MEQKDETDLNSIFQREQKAKEARLARLPPLTPGQERWWVGSTDEWYDGGNYETREEAIKAGLDQYELGFHIVCAKTDPVDIAAHFDLDRLIEDIDESGEYVSGEGRDSVFDDCSPYQLDDLEHQIRLAIRIWQIELQEQGIHLKGDMLTSSHSHEYIRRADIEGVE